VFAVLPRALFLLVFLFGLRAEADLTWSGMYRLEGQQLGNHGLTDNNEEKTYATQHLILKPKIVAADGYIVRARLDVFNNSDFLESQIGQTFGTDRADNATLSDATAENHAPDEIQVSELYLTLTNEYGAFIAGRHPLKFGLGMTYSDGSGDFDHWLDNRDSVGYKVVMGNMFFYPSYGKISEGDIEDSLDDISTLTLQVGYEAVDSGIELGLMYDMRDAATRGNDSNLPTNVVGGTGATLANRLKTNQMNIFLSKKTETLRFAVEAAFQDGNTGVEDADGKDVKLSGFGVATELDWKKKDSRWALGSKLGYASGDDPETTDQWEGFIFDRNYDVGFLLFNFPMGQADFFRTALVGSQTGLEGTTVGSKRRTSPDIEALSNAIYFAPHAEYALSDRWKMRGTFVTGVLTVDPLDTDTELNLGYEFDFAFIYKPSDRVTWVNEVGYFTPGTAFEGGTNDFDTGAAFGLRSKAAINF
jgi:hypothetical protein